MAAMAAAQRTAAFADVVSRLHCRSVEEADVIIEPCQVWLEPGDTGQVLRIKPAQPACRPP
jgi:hypothetical protein